HDPGDPGFSSPPYVRAEVFLHGTSLFPVACADASLVSRSSVAPRGRPGDWHRFSFRAHTNAGRFAPGRGWKFQPVREKDKVAVFARSIFQLRQGRVIIHVSQKDGVEPMKNCAANVRRTVTHRSLILEAVR